MLTGVVDIKSGIPSAVLEVFAELLLANFIGVGIEPWLDFLGTFGDLMLTFLAGAEIDLFLLETYAKQSFTQIYICSDAWSFVHS